MIEDVTIWTIASIVKYLNEAKIGLPIEVKQIGNEAEPKQIHPGKIEFSIEGPNFDKIGTRSEIYATLILSAFVSSKDLPSDIFFHTRIKARVIGVMEQVIPVSRRGDKKYDKSQFGILTPMKQETIMVEPVMIQDKNASVITRVYQLEAC